VKIGPDGFVYYLENGSSGVLPKGIYRLHDDVIPNGHCNDAGEVTPFFIPSALGGTSSHFGMAVDRSGVWYLVDSGNDVIWQATDINNDLTITPGTAEAVVYWTAPGTSLNWMVECDSGVSIYTAESQSPDRILKMSDTVVVNGTVNDPGEVVSVYDQSISLTSISNPRSLAFARSPTLALPLTASIGTSQVISVQADSFVPFELWISTGTGSVPIAPYGILGLSLAPSEVYGPLVGGLIPANGQFALLTLVPNDPSAVGLSLTFQAWVGPYSRVEFSQALTVTITL
jgi:hypothetical protein